MTPAEREIDQLIDELNATVDPDERHQIERAIRDIEREIAEEDRWREDGRNRGWL